MRFWLFVFFLFISAKVQDKPILYYSMIFFSHSQLFFNILGKKEKRWHSDSPNKDHSLSQLPFPAPNLYLVFWFKEHKPLRMYCSAPKAKMYFLSSFNSAYFNLWTITKLRNLLLPDITLSVFLNVYLSSPREKLFASIICFARKWFSVPWKTDKSES